jgi:hypothetical protein
MLKTDSKKLEKPYTKPTLTVYGKVQELTQTIAPNGSRDGGTGNRTTSH